METANSEASERVCESLARCSTGCSADEENLDVYVIMRPFSEYGGPTLKHVPRPIRRGLAEIGVCHYLTAFRTPEGRVVTYDFGPEGGDVHVGLPVRPSPWLNMPSFNRAPSAHVQLSAPAGCVTAPGEMLVGKQVAGTAPPGTDGQIREVEIETLPLGHWHVGRTALTLDDIRDFNSQQNLRYNLNSNDCRHYVNNLVMHTTGVHGASSSLIKHLHELRQDRPRWNHRLKRFAQSLTDVNNWPTIRSVGITVGQATLTAAAVVIGRLGAQPLLRHTPAAFSLPAASPASQAASLLTRPIRAGTVASMASWAVEVRESRILRRTVMFGSRVSRTVRRSLVGAVRGVVRPRTRSNMTALPFSGGSAAQSASFIASRSISRASARARHGVSRLLTSRMQGSAAPQQLAASTGELPRSQPPKILALASILGSREIGR